MIDSAFSDPSQRLIDSRLDDDVEQIRQDDDISLKRSFRSVLTKRRIAIISGVTLSALLIIGLVLTGVFVSRIQYTKRFESNLRTHVKTNFSAIDQKLIDTYVEELTTLYKRGKISFDHVLEFDTVLEFDKFNKEYKKVHANNNERAEKFLAFRNTLLSVKSHKGHETFSKAINIYADLTEKEFNRLFPPIKVPKEKSPTAHLEMLMSQRGADTNFLEQLAKAKDFVHPITSLNDITADGIDWRKSGGVTKVKDQGLCGSCWAFASIASVESLHKIYKGKTLDLSEQELVNCESHSNGCEGGFSDTALEYIKNKGISSTLDVPYHAVDSECSVHSHDKTFIGALTITKGIDILQKSLVMAPTIVYIGASNELATYKSGVYNGSCASQLNHAVLLVGEGYDEVLGKRYWIIKNSWGPYWGENGYLRLERTNKGYDKCGVLTTGISPLF